MDITSLLGLINPMSWIEKAVQYWRRPKLQVYFDPTQTFHTRTVVDLNNSLGYFVHLMVSNNGAKVAMNCTASLIRLKLRSSSGQFEPHPNYLNPIILKWAHESDFDPRNIDPDLPRRLDLCFGIERRPHLFSFMTKRIPSGNQIDYSPGTYLATVRMRAENAQPVDASFEITYRGVWNEFDVKTFPS